MSISNKKNFKNQSSGCCQKPLTTRMLAKNFDCSFTLENINYLLKKNFWAKKAMFCV